MPSPHATPSLSHTHTHTRQCGLFVMQNDLPHHANVSHSWFWCRMPPPPPQTHTLSHHANISHGGLLMQDTPPPPTHTHIISPCQRQSGSAPGAAWFPPPPPPPHTHTYIISPCQRQSWWAPDAGWLPLWSGDPPVPLPAAGLCSCDGHHPPCTSCPGTSRWSTTHTSFHTASLCMPGGNTMDRE